MMRRLFLPLLAAGLLCAGASRAADFETATDAVKRMGVGWNLGNTLEANSQSETNAALPTYWGQQDLNSETCWGQYTTKRELLTMLRDAGFGAIRVPVTWYNHMSYDGTIDAAWMKRVHEVVDYVLATGMYCIINVHHDTGADGTNYKSWIKASDANFASNQARFESIWRQIAEEFRDYGEQLLFEGYNEMLDTENSWCFASFNASGQYNATIAATAYSAINKFAQSFVDVVRRSGGNNAQRNLIVSTYGACCGSGTWNSHLKDPLKNMKKPAGEGSHLIFEVHTYPSIENGLASAKAELDDMLAALKTHLMAQGAPVIIGEWGTSNVDKGAGKTDYDVRRTTMLDYADYFVQQSKAAGIATFYWMGLTDGISRIFPAFDQPDLALRILQAYHGKSHTPQLPTLDDYADVGVAATVSYTSQWAEFNLFRGSVSAAQYQGLQLELEKAPAAGELQFKAYSSNKTQAITTATSTFAFTTAMSTITQITLQWCKATAGSVRVKSIWLLKKDGTRERCLPSVFWGCSVSDVDTSPTAGIRSVVADDGRQHAVYDLTGRRTSATRPGLYLRGGKKFVRR